MNDAMTLPQCIVGVQLGRSCSVGLAFTGRSAVTPVPTPHITRIQFNGYESWDASLYVAASGPGPHVFVGDAARTTAAARHDGGALFSPEWLAAGPTDGTILETRTIRASNGDNSVRFLELLTILLQHVNRTVRDRFAHEDPSIGWVICLPPLWKYSCSNIVRRAAHAAGMIETLEAPTLACMAAHDAALTSIRLLPDVYLERIITAYSTLLLVECNWDEISVHNVMVAAAEASSIVRVADLELAETLPGLLPASANAFGVFWKSLCGARTVTAPARMSEDGLHAELKSLLSQNEAVSDGDELSIRLSEFLEPPEWLAAQVDAYNHDGPGGTLRLNRRGDCLRLQMPLVRAFLQSSVRSIAQRARAAADDPFAALPLQVLVFGSAAACPLLQDCLRNELAGVDVEPRFLAAQAKTSWGLSGSVAAGTFPGSFSVASALCHPDITTEKLLRAVAVRLKASERRALALEERLERAEADRAAQMHNFEARLAAVEAFHVERVARRAPSNPAA